MSIILDHINYCYSADSAYKVQALKDVSLEINDGEFIGIIGHTGSGKSTLIQHMNGLLKATSGHIYYNGQDIYDNDYDLSKLRHKVGMVFQYPDPCGDPCRRIPSRLPEHAAYESCRPRG